MRRLTQWDIILLLIAFLIILGGFAIAGGFGPFQRSVGWGLLIMGLGVMGVGSTPLRVEYRYRRYAHRAEGIIIDYKKDVPELSENKAWLPTVRFTPPSGQEVTFQNSDAVRPKSHPISSRVTVLYDPEEPEIAIITPIKANIGAYFAVLFGLALIGGGIFSLMGR